jgi:hypothetical protein
MQPTCDTDELVDIVTVVDILPNEAPPAVLTVTLVDGPRGVTRHMTQQVPVPDAALFERLVHQVRAGDQIEATLVNEWREAGCVTYLADFGLVIATAPASSNVDATAPPFNFASGAVVAHTLDDLLLASVSHWEEAKAALEDGRFERWLRSVGEVYIADLAADLASSHGGAAMSDERLHEFLFRAGLDVDVLAAVAPPFTLSQDTPLAYGNLPLPRRARSAVA